MRTLILAALLSTGTLIAQAASSTPVATSSASQTALIQALQGRWVGVLDYRDYSEPPTSEKRVHLPTWLTIAPATEGISCNYAYDDGPNKILFNHSALVIDLPSRTYKVLGTDAVNESYTITNPEALHDGRGTLTLTGQGADNNKPAEIRATWTIRRNLLSWFEEVRPAGSSAPFTFRHQYTFTRADPPTPSASLPK